MAYKDSNTTLTDEQYAELKTANPSLAAGYSFVGGATPAPSGGSLGSKDIKDISQNQLIDAFAKAGNTKAKQAQSNNYTLPSPSNTSSGLPAPNQANSLSALTEKNLPEATKRSSLVDFADALDQATALARGRRQKSELGILEDFGFKPGQVTASTMGQILNLLEARTDKSHSAIQGAAMDAYKTQEEQKATEQSNIQNLGLQLLTSGNIDPIGMQGVLNSGSFDAALGVAAGLIKASGDYDDVTSSTVNGQLQFFGVKKDGTIDNLGTFGDKTASGRGDGYAPTNDIKEYQYAVAHDNYGGTFEEWKNDKKDNSPDFTTAQLLVDANPGASEAEVRVALLSRASDLNMSVTDINSIIASHFGQKKEVKEGAIKLMVDVWNPEILLKREGGELTAAKAAAIKKIYEPPYNVEKGSKKEQDLLKVINNLTFADVEDEFNKR